MTAPNNGRLASNWQPGTELRMATRARGPRKFSPAQPRQGRAGCASASRMKWPRGHAATYAATCAIRRATPRKPWPQRLPPGARPHPPAAGRGAGPRAARDGDVVLATNNRIQTECPDKCRKITAVRCDRSVLRPTTVSLVYQFDLSVKPFNTSRICHERRYIIGNFNGYLAIGHIPNQISQGLFSRHRD